MAQAERISQDAPTDRLLAFIEFLRGRDILISPADSLVAMEVAGLVGYNDRKLLKNGLGSALAKSKFEIEIFNEAFEQYFGAPSPDKGVFLKHHNLEHIIYRYSNQHTSLFHL